VAGCSCGPEGPPTAARAAPLTRLVRLSSLAALDLQQARNYFDHREAGLGDRFLASVEQTLERISQNADQYQVALLDLHRAPIRPFQYSIWYRVLPDESIVVAALSDRRDLSLARRRALRPTEPT
jgi:plasmid stabilization system protein ParE